MAVIGCLGDILFFVSRGTMRTLEGMKWDSGVKYAVQERHLNEPLLELTGVEVESISFSMILSAFLGMKPMEELSQLLFAAREGKVMRLVLGTHAYGTNKWVITKLSSALERFDAAGNLLHVKVTVTLNAYAAR